jgi:phenylalanyl-tRNA synthetase alpha chain
MEQELQRIRGAAFRELEQASDVGAVNEIRVKVLGKKGDLTAVLRGMGSMDPADRPRMGQLVNDLRLEFENALLVRMASLKDLELAKRLEAEKIDVTLPGRTRGLGRRHPLTLALDLIKQVFLQMGFDIEEGPEVESDYYNFEALNLPPDHPARDMQDSFYITDQFLLRTHTSPVQVRTMQAREPNAPIRMIAPGKVYRRDYDATHSPMFQQVEGLVVGPDIKFSDLKGTLELFCQGIFGNNVKVRFRPSYFPFTEPSAEVDISCVICKGSGCRVCKGTGWLEILGSGMVHPRVLEMSQYDPKQVSGFAFGMGVERIAMLAYGIDDMRLFYENDVRFLRRF